MYSYANSATLYVHPRLGDDLASGLTAADEGLHGPFRSLDRALTAVKEMRAVGDKRPMRICLLDDLCLDAPLTIDTDLLVIDGNGHAVIGGLRLEDWKEDTFYGVPCRSCRLPEGTAPFTDLWVDGHRAEAPRFPEEGYLEAIDVENHGEALFDSSRWFVAKTEDLCGIDNLTDAIVNYYHYWVDEHSPIESYDAATGKLVMAYASRFRLDTVKDSPARLQYYLTGIPNTFGKENHWYLDRKAGRVYYCGEVTSALCPTLPYLFKVTAANVSLENLTLTCTKGDYLSRHTAVGHNCYVPSEDEAYASDIQSVCWAGGALIFENAANASVEHCTLTALGLHGIEIGTGCTAICIEDCRITDCGAGGIKIFGGAYEEDPALVTAHCRIEHCEIAHCGRRYAAGCGILANHTSYLSVIGNHIHHLDYTGISVGWVWGYGNSSTFGCRIEENHIHHIGMGRLSDMGAVYLLGNQPGTVVCRNRIHDVTSANYGGWGIYADEGSGNLRIENNVVFRTKEASFHQHYGHNNVVRNNIFAFGGDGCVRISKNELHTTVLFEQNIYLSDGQPIHHYAHIPGGNGGYSAEARGNLCFDLRGKVTAFRGLSLEEFVAQTGKESGSLEADPLFVDPKNGNFALSPDSPAIGLGFRPIVGFPAVEE